MPGVRQVVVELRSDGRVCGTMVGCDADLNLELAGCEVYPPPWGPAALAPGGGVRRLEKTRIRGSAVRLVVLPEGTDPAAALQRERARQRRGAATFARQRQRPAPARPPPAGRAEGPAA